MRHRTHPAAFRAGRARCRAGSRLSGVCRRFGDCGRRRRSKSGRKRLCRYYLHALHGRKRFFPRFVPCCARQRHLLLFAEQSDRSRLYKRAACKTGRFCARKRLHYRLRCRIRFVYTKRRTAQIDLRNRRRAFLRDRNQFVFKAGGLYGRAPRLVGCAAHACLRRRNAGYKRLEPHYDDNL